MLRTLLPESKALWIDLLDLETERLLTSHPEKLNEILSAERERSKPRPWVVIAEIQKSPKLLSIVHQQIQKKTLKFSR